MCEEEIGVDRACGSLLGLGIGDAMGVTQEMIPRGGGTNQQLHQKVLLQRKQRKRFRGIQEKMEGGGPFMPNIKIKPGEYTDDTAMAICIADSLLIQKGFNPTDIMHRFCLWSTEGYNAARREFKPELKKTVGIPWGIGGNVSKALSRFKNNPNNPIAGGTGPMDAGNGAIMRLAPIPIYYHSDINLAIENARIQASLTHNVQEAIDASAFMAQFIVRAIEGQAITDIFIPNTEICGLKNPEIISLCSEDAEWRKKEEHQIVTLPGRTLWSLEAALWSIHKTNNFRDAIITAINLGGDADTVGAITGQLAGAIYGEKQIPTDWLNTLVHKDKIRERANALYWHLDWNEEWTI